MTQPKNALMTIDAYLQIDEGSISWKMGGYNRPDRSVGEQGGYFDDFEIDRDATDAETLGLWDELSSDEQDMIQNHAHDQQVENYLNDPGF